MILGHSLTKNLLKNSYIELSSFRVIWEKPGTFWTPNGQYYEYEKKKTIMLPIQLNSMNWYISTFFLNYDK